MGVDQPPPSGPPPGWTWNGQQYVPPQGQPYTPPGQTYGPPPNQPPYSGQPGY